MSTLSYSVKIYLRWGNVWPEDSSVQIREQWKTWKCFTFSFFFWTSRELQVPLIVCCLLWKERYFDFDFKHFDYIYHIYHQYHHNQDVTVMTHKRADAQVLAALAKVASSIYVALALICVALIRIITIVRNTVAFGFYSSPSSSSSPVWQTKCLRHLSPGSLQRRVKKMGERK